MPCKIVPVKNGVAIMCSRGHRHKKCAYCQRESTKLCDGPGKEPGKTCDVPMCKYCAANYPGQDLDYCREHAKDMRRAYHVIAEMVIQLGEIDKLLDELDKKNGDYPRSGIDRCSRIRVLSGHSKLDEAKRVHGLDFAACLERMVNTACQKYVCSPADLEIVEETRKMGTEKVWFIRPKQATQGRDVR